MDHEAIRQAIAAYALDSIAAAERAAVERELLEHLPGCAECSAMMREFRELSGDLALAAPAALPPTSLETRILSAVREERPAPLRPGRRRMVARVAAAIAILALGASAALNVALLGRADRADRRAEALAPLLDLAADPLARSVALRGRAGSLSIVFRPGGDAFLVGRDVAEPGAGRVLALWFLDGARPVPVSFFRPRNGDVLVRLAVDPAAFARAAVTEEPGRVPAPTSDPIFEGALS